MPPPALQRALAEAEARARKRRESLPRPSLDSDLPVLAHREALCRAIADEQVVIVSGATGSGKSTQLPQLALAAGRGRRGYIGHTQPRRLAASSLARRIATELGEELGAGVGFKVRFRDRVGEDTAVKLMTDGMLLAEVHSDPELLGYDTIILDEAHERTLNIDFLLGYLRRLLPQRPDLRVIITSATIEPERYARYFGGARVIEVEGRTHPVDVRYEPPARGLSLEEAVAEAALGLVRSAPGDVLAFLPGEKQIRATARLLSRRAGGRCEVLPLYARLPAREQDRIFAPEGRGPRVVLATNVAETSITVPGIRYVVDAGLARVARYSPHAAVQRLPIEPIAKSSAEQRKGRAGRTAPGVCVRLYAEEDYAGRPEFTEPEILRSGLDGVLLRMAALRLGPAEEFPFLDPPAPKHLRAGYRDLQMLGAMDAERRLTGIGRRLARMPVDPRLGRILVAAEEFGVVDAALTVVAALAVADPRERPADAREAADAAHAEWKRTGSDFLADVALWEWYVDARKTLGRRPLERELRARFLSPARIREWASVRRELAAQVDRRRAAAPAGRDAGERLHRAVLTAFLDRVAGQVPDPGKGGAWITARGRRVDIFPGSAMAGKRPHFIVAAQLVETSRLFAHRVAMVRPDWVEAAAAHLVSRQVDAPEWDRERGRVLGRERVSLYGLTLVEGRPADYARHAPEEARRIFIREALVEGDWPTRSRGVLGNRARIEALERDEARGRRRDLLRDTAGLEAFYGELIPADVLDGPRFERWSARAEADDPGWLEAPDEVFVATDGRAPDQRDYPETLELGSLSLPVRYCFEPGREDDGLTVRVPAAGLAQVDGARAEWLIPGLLEDKITAIIRALPKTVRRRFAPAPEYARALAERLVFGEGDLYAVMARELKGLNGTGVSPAELRAGTLPRHLALRFEVTGEDGAVLAAERDLAALQRRFAEAHASAFSARKRATGTFEERARVDDWDFGDLPPRVALDAATGLSAFPALQATPDGVALRLFPTQDAAAAAHEDGVRALLRTRLRPAVRDLRRSLPTPSSREMVVFGLDVPGLRDDVIDAALRDLMADRSVPWTQDAFATLCGDVGPRLAVHAREVADRLVPEVERGARLAGRLAGDDFPEAWAEAVADMQRQLHELVRPGFVAVTPPRWRRRLGVYLMAMERRLERLSEDPARDLSRLRRVEPLVRRALNLDASHGAATELRFLIEELRVQTFAQELGTTTKVSVPRLERRLEDAERQAA